MGLRHPRCGICGNCGIWILCFLMMLQLKPACLNPGLQTPHPKCGILWRWAAPQGPSRLQPSRGLGQSRLAAPKQPRSCSLFTSSATPFSYPYSLVVHSLFLYKLILIGWPSHPSRRPPRTTPRTTRPLAAPPRAPPCLDCPRPSWREESLHSKGCASRLATAPSCPPASSLRPRAEQPKASPPTSRTSPASCSSSSCW